MRTKRWVGTVLASLLTFQVVSAIVSGGASAAAPDFPALLPNQPYLRLFTQVNDCLAVRNANQLSGSALTARLDELTRWYVHFHSEGSNGWVLGNDCKGSSSTTLASKLSDRGVWTSNYRNGSFVSQANQGQVNFGEAADLETKAPLSIGTYWAGNYRPNIAGDNSSTAARLTQPLAAGDTTVAVSAVSDRPSGMPATWPFLNSRGAGLNANAHSQNTFDFVSWIRVDNEMMQIVSDPQLNGSTVTLSVRRGLWGTNAAAHAANARVMSPTYIGNVNGESQLNGTPLRADASSPLRYALKLWQPEAGNWIADRIQSTFGAGLQGFNTIWLDVSSCFQDNHADPYGNPVFGWYDVGDTKMMGTQYGAAQKAKLAVLRSRFPGVKFTGNNMTYNDACSNDLLNNAYDGGTLENYVKMEMGANYASQMDLTFDSMANNSPALFWTRFDYLMNGNVDAYKRFAYASVLLAYRQSATRYQFGQTFNLDKPAELYFWNWGTPQGNPTQLSDVAIPGTPLYRRDFQNGFVVVNPSGSSVNYSLGGTFYDTVHETNGVPSPVTSVTVGPYDAAFLLRPAAGGGGGGGSTPSQTPAPSPSQAPAPSPSPSQAPSQSPAPPAPVMGNFPVGTTTITVPSGSRSVTVTVKYPATSAGTDTPVAPGTHPLIVVGHGAALTGVDSANQNAFLATAGYIVAGPSFGNVTSNIAQGAGDVSAVITNMSGLSSGLLAGKVDGTRVGYLGTSMGGMIGFSLLQGSTRDARIKAMVIRAGMASGSGSLASGTALLQMHGTADTTIPFSSGQAAYTRAQAPKAFISLAGAGHDLNVSGPLFKDGPIGFFARFLLNDPNGLTKLSAAVAATSVASMSADWGTQSVPPSTPPPTIPPASPLPSPSSSPSPVPSTSPSPSPAPSPSPSPSPVPPPATTPPPAPPTTQAPPPPTTPPPPPPTTPPPAPSPPPVPDSTAPNTTLTAPTAGSTAPMGTVAIRGSATDNRGVSQVTVAIRNRVSRLWLQPNGSWGSTYQGLPASLAAPGSGSTGWNYQWHPGTTGSFILMIKSKDAAGNMDPSPAGASFKVGYDRRAARARLATHKPRSHPGGRGRGGVMLRGTAFDDEAVGAVMVAIKSKRTGRYWHPHHQWGRAHYFRAHMGTPGARSSNWRFHLWLRPGRYRLQLASLDSSGNLHIRWIRFRVRHPR